MLLSQVLRPEDICLNLKSSRKIDAIKEIVDRLAANGRTIDKVRLFEAILEREELQTTALSSGVALPHARIDAAGELILTRQTDPQPLHRAVQIRQIVGHRLVHAGRVLRIVSRHHPQQQRGVGHRPAERADLIQRRRKGHQPVARHAPICRLEPHEPTKGSRLADRSAGVRSNGCAA